MLIIEQATSLDWIWKELKNLYQITHVGKDFLNIVDIKYDPENSFLKEKASMLVYKQAKSRASARLCTNFVR